jgi:hypothetical protein
MPDGDQGIKDYFWLNYDCGAIAERSLTGQRPLRDEVDPVTDKENIENECMVN